MIQSITIWKVGSPHRGDIPLADLPEDIELMTRDLGLACDVHAFPAKDFHLVFAQAVQEDRAPDVLVNDNYGILEGIVTPLGTFTGVFTLISKNDMMRVSCTLDSFLGDHGGWVWLIKGSPKHEAALKLVHRKPPVPATWVDTQSPPAIDIASVRDTAFSAAKAYLQNDAQALWPLLDPDHMMLRDDEHRHASRSNPVEYDIEIARIWGNDKLAFCGVLYTWSPQQNNSVGGSRAVLALRKVPDGDWRVLFVASDPVTKKQLNHEVPELAHLFVSNGDEFIKPVQLIAPDNGEMPVPLSRDAHSDDSQDEVNEDDYIFGYFVWQRDPASKPVAELVEFAYCDYLIGDTRAIILKSNLSEQQGRISSGNLWSVGVRWQWRVWTIGKNGSITFSAWREFYH